MNKSEFTDETEMKFDSDKAEYENFAAKSNATISAAGTKHPESGNNIAGTEADLTTEPVSNDEASDVFDMPELTPEFQEEYKRVMTENLPDLWSRIESALPEKAVTVFAAGQANVVSETMANRESAGSKETAANRETAGSKETAAYRETAGEKGATENREAALRSPEMIEFENQGRQDKKETTKKRFSVSRYAILIAACICGLLIIPAVILSRNGKRFFSEAEKGAENIYFAAADEAADAVYTENWDDDSVEESCEAASDDVEEAICEDEAYSMGIQDGCMNGVNSDWSGEKELAEGSFDEAAIKDIPAEAAESPAEDAMSENLWDDAEEEMDAAIDEVSEAAESTGGKYYKEMSSEENAEVIETIFEKVTGETLTKEQITLQDYNLVVSGVNLTILESHELETGEILYFANVEDRSFQMPVGDKTITVPKGRMIILYSGQRITNGKGQNITSICELDSDRKYSCDLYPMNLSGEKVGEGYEFYVLEIQSD